MSTVSARSIRTSRDEETEEEEAKEDKDEEVDLCDDHCVMFKTIKRRSENIRTNNNEILIVPFVCSHLLPTNLCFTS
jgi:hypothetical protein